MAELDDKSKQLAEELEGLSSAFSSVTKNLEQFAKDAAASREFTKLNAQLNSAASQLAILNREYKSNQERVNLLIKSMANFESALDSKNFKLASDAARQLARSFNKPGLVEIIDKVILEGDSIEGSEIGKLMGLLAETVEHMHNTNEDAITSLVDVDNRQKLASAAFEEAQKALENLSSSIQDNAITNNRFATQMKTVADKLKDFRNSNPAQKQLYYGEALMRAGEALLAFRNSIYEIQAKLGTTFATAFDKTVGAATQVIASYFRTGPALTAKDTIDTINAFQKEFGMLLTTGEAGRIAQVAKSLGTNAEIYFRAQRAFLGAGGIGGQARIQQQFITQFRSAGLTANQALAFAANNANLIAIAGTRYANELARAAANAQRIGVGLDKTEQLADTLVGDFEGALERFSELRAMGVEVDFNRLAAVAGTGTPEEVVKELSGQLGGNRALLEQIQRNRFLKVAIERDLGLSIADVSRLAGGEGVVPVEKTVEEKTNELLGGILKWLPIITKSIGALVTVMAVNALGLGPIGTILGVIGGLAALKGLSGGTVFANDMTMGPGSDKLILSPRGSVRLHKDDSIAAGTDLFGGKGNTSSINGKRDTLERVNVVVGVAGKSIAEEAARTALRQKVNMITGIGDFLAGSMVTYDTYKENKDLPEAIAKGMGYVATSLLGGLLGAVTTGPAAIAGEAVGSSAAGEAYLSATAPSAGRVTLPAPSLRAQTDTTTVKVDTSTLEAKMDKVVNAISLMKIDMDGNTVGRVSLNARSPLDRLSVVG